MKIRFSLLTLLLLSLWLGLAGVVYARREPWEFDPSVYPTFHSRCYHDSKWDLRDHISQISPDGKRRIWDPYDKGPKLQTCAYDNSWHAIDLDLEDRWNDWASRVIGFVDNDTLLYVTWTDNENRDRYFRYAHRRFPEWWWGHFYRPEVWALILLTIAIVVRQLRAGKAQPQPAAAVLPDSHPE